METEKQLGQPGTINPPTAEALSDEQVFRGTILALRYLTFAECTNRAEYLESAKSWLWEALHRVNNLSESVATEQ